VSRASVKFKSDGIVAGGPAQGTSDLPENLAEKSIQDAAMPTDLRRFEEEHPVPRIEITAACQCSGPGYASDLADAEGGPDCTATSRRRGLGRPQEVHWRKVL